MEEINWDDLIPELKDWHDEEANWETWLASVADFQQAIAYSQRFWPRFTEYKGCVFLEDKFGIDVYEMWMKESKDDATAVEKLINHEHLLDFFGNPDLPANEKQLDFLGQRLIDMWSCKLKRDFPNKEILFQYIKGTADNLMDYQITFYQKRQL